MPYEIQTTTAEDIIGATDAALQQNDGADRNFVSNFLDIPFQNANNALTMAEQLGLLKTNQKGFYHAVYPFACYLVTSDPLKKAVILRMVLEQYYPYEIFKHRLVVTGNANVAANQVHTILGLTAHRNDISSTFVSLGTFTNSLISEGAGRYRESGELPEDLLYMLNEVIEDRELAEARVRTKLGNEASDWINHDEVFIPLVTAYQAAASSENDSRAPIVYAGNAIESFLSQVANYFKVNINNANGINAKVDRLKQAKKLKSKHAFMTKYLGHIRNATDHGVDAEIGQAWTITSKTAVEYVHIAQSVISAIVAAINNQFQV